MPLISASTLRQFAEEILLAAGVPPHKAALVATTLVATNLRGVDSHGIQLLTFYVDQLLAGELDAQTDGRVVSENGSCLLFDGQNGIGQWVAEVCCGHAVRIARAQGMAMVVARESNHFGACNWWAQKMRDAGQIGIVMCNASPIVPPWQGREGRFGHESDLRGVAGAVAARYGHHHGGGRQSLQGLVNGQPEIPAGWAFDAHGVPTTNTEAAYKGMLMPLGGYKGSGLAMMVEILCGLLGGGAMATEVGGIRFRGRTVRVSQTFIAIDIARFMPLAEFTARMERLVEQVKATPAAPGYDEVLVAGEPEWRTEARRSSEGIPIADGNWASLVKTAGRVGVGVPE